jgi:hypothetical protein
MADGDLARAYDFLARGDMYGTRTANSSVGRVVYLDELPHRLDANYLWVEREAEAEEIAAEARGSTGGWSFSRTPSSGSGSRPTSPTTDGSCGE